MTRRGHVSVGAALAVGYTALAAAALAQERTPLGPSQSISAALEQYDCGRIDGAQTKHVGQFVAGRYQEWLESYVVAGSEHQTLCITQVIPSRGTLSRDDALALLLASAGLDLRERARALMNSETTRREITPDREVRPIPLGEVSPDSVERATRERRQSTEPTAGATPDVPSGIEAFSIRDGSPTMGRNRDDAAPRLDPGAVPDPGASDHVQEAPKPRRRDEPPQDENGATLIPRLERERAQVDAIDDRVRVSSTTSFPWNTIAILYVEFPDGSEGTCTGTLVSPRTVLTAGHCIHSRDNGGLASYVSVAPGQNMSLFFGIVTQPFGERFAQYGATTERWKSVSGGGSHPIKDYKYDYAALFFEQPWTYTQTFMPIVYRDTGGPVNSAGYPGTVDNRPNVFGMWHDFGPETAISTLYWRDLQIREFALDSSPGNSGGPFWLYYSSTNRSELTGTLSYGVANKEVAGGPWMGGDNETTIRSWVNWTPGSPLPSADKKGLRMTALAGAATDVYASYLRFYNASAASGTVRVALSDAETGATLGSWTSAPIQPRASRQFAIADIEKATTPAIATPTIYTASITSTFDGYMQHIAWNPGGASLTNMTGCSNGLSDDVTTIINFHSSRLADGYASTMYFHNVGSRTAEASVDIYDAANGSYIGGFVWDDVPPDATYYLDSEDVDFYLKQFYGFVPSASQNHYIIELDGDFPGYMQHAIDNAGAGVITSMTAKCDLRAE